MVNSPQGGAGDSSATLSEDAVGVGAVAVKAALSQSNTDEDDGEGRPVAMYELIADLHAGGAPSKECSSCDDEVVCLTTTRNGPVRELRGRTPLEAAAWL